MESDDPVFINPFSHLAANQNGNCNAYQLYQIIEMQKKGLQKKNLKKSMKENYKLNKIEIESNNDMVFKMSKK